MLSIIKANYQDKYKISLLFSDHKRGVVDLRGFIFNTNIKAFKRLRDTDVFKKFDVKYTLKWDDDLDLAPEYLYFKAFETDEKLKAKFHKWGYVSSH